MWNVSTITHPKARKEYKCEAYEFIHHVGIGREDLTTLEWESFTNFDGVIKKGDVYVNCHGIWEGEPSTFRANLDMDAICQKYDFYED